MGLNAALALAATIYVFVLNAKSAPFDLEYAVAAAPESSGTFTYGQGTFNKEGWACTARAFLYFDADLGGAVARTCSIEMGSRWLTLFTFLLSTLLFSMFYRDSRGGKFFMRS